MDPFKSRYINIKYQEKLFRSINSGNLKKVQESLEEYPELINERKYKSGYKYGLFYGETPLTITVKKYTDYTMQLATTLQGYQLNIIKYLLDNGADPEISNLEEETPLKIAKDALIKASSLKNDLILDNINEVIILIEDKIYEKIYRYEQLLSLSKMVHPRTGNIRYQPRESKLIDMIAAYVSETPINVKRSKSRSKSKSKSRSKSKSDSSRTKRLKKEFLEGIKSSSSSSKKGGKRKKKKTRKKKQFKNKISI